MLWAADRGGDRLIALDGELHVLRSLRVGAPCEVEAAGEDLIWVLRSWTRSARGPDEVVLLAGDGTVRVRVTLERAFDLVTLPGLRAAVLGRRAEGEPGAIPILLSLDGVVRELGGRADFVALAACGTDLLAGAASGELSRWSLRELSGPPIERVLPAPLEDLAGGPRPGTWWALCREPGGARLFLLDENLEPCWDRTLGGVHGPLVPASRAEQVWLTASDGACCLAVGRTGALECFRAELPALSSGPGAPRPGGGVLLVSPGAILALDASGASAPGQAGFEELTDLDLVRE
jgi:hypothetical protein